MKLALIAVGVLVLGAIAVRKAAASRKTPSAPKSSPPKPPPLDISRFQEYADLYERRYLAYLVEETAENLGFDGNAIDRLRAHYGKEVLPPPYEAQGWLYAKGVPLADILHMQTEWLRRNGGNPDARPAAREVERIVKARNQENARKICREAGLG